MQPDGPFPASFAVIVLGSMLGGLLLVVLVVVVLVRTFTAGDRARLPVAPDGTVVLTAHVFRPDQQFSPRAALSDAAYGTLTVTAVDLRWDGRDGTRWAAPLRATAVVAVHGGMSFVADASLDIDIAGSGAWRLVVSDRSINRFVRNDAKRFREAGVARLLAETLVARGAADLRGPAR